MVYYEYGAVSTYLFLCTFALSEVQPTLLSVFGCLIQLLKPLLALQTLLQLLLLLLGLLTVCRLDVEPLQQTKSSEILS